MALRHETPIQKALEEVRRIRDDRTYAVLSEEVEDLLDACESEDEEYVLDKAHNSKFPLIAQTAKEIALANNLKPLADFL